MNLIILLLYLFSFDAQIDVGTVQILFPKGPIRDPDSLALFEPQAVILNFGDTTVSFPVIFKIENLYADTQSVSNLLPHVQDTLTFSPWEVSYNPDPTTYQVSCSTAHELDINRQNDRIIESMILKFTDLTVDIITPFDSLNPGDIIGPRFRIWNHASFTDSFPFICHIIYLSDTSLVYADTIDAIIVQPGGSRNFACAPWVVGPPGPYKGWLRFDTIPFKDTFSFQFEVTTVAIEQHQNRLDYGQLLVYQNPTQGNCKIEFTPTSNSDINISIYNREGRLVKTIGKKGIMAGNKQILIWNGEDNSDRKVPSGIYFIRFKAENFLTTTKVILQQ